VNIPSPQFRPDPERAIFVRGEITRELVQELTPQIIRLKETAGPITVYIDSPGGSVFYMFALLRLLQTRSQDFVRPHIITVATHQAASAAADLLSAGDFALVYPHSRILFHGGRFFEREVTAEQTAILAQELRRSNESSAMELARQIEFRFILRFIVSKNRFNDVRQETANPDMSDLDCFLHLISQYLSETAVGILNGARERFGRYDGLVQTVQVATRNLPPDAPSVEREAVQLKAIVDFELEQNRLKPDWSFRDGGVDGLVSDFLLYQEYTTLTQNDRFISWISTAGRLMLSPEEAEEINNIQDEAERAVRWSETVSPLLRPIWSFFVALCFTLQRGENEYLNAVDSYWLGLIDEVIGDANLSALRLMQEDKDDPEEEPAQAIEEPAN
jgi:ATP-dependent protease ClpP protease subunit